MFDPHFLSQCLAHNNRSKWHIMVKCYRFSEDHEDLACQKHGEGFHHEQGIKAGSWLGIKQTGVRISPRRRIICIKLEEGKNSVTVMRCSIASRTQHHFLGAQFVMVQLFKWVWPKLSFGSMVSTAQINTLMTAYLFTHLLNKYYVDSFMCQAFC